MHINWYPGHMAKARRMIEENLKKVDVVIELLDARIPRSSANPMIREIIGAKPHIIVLNKVDLANPQTTKEWVEFFNEEGIDVITVDSKSGKGTKALVRLVEKKSQPIIEKWTRRGIKGRSIRTIILGIPNVGKSTLINMLAKSGATQTANKPGKTRGPQWVRIGKNMELLDTPGVLWPKLEDQRAAARLAITGAISDDVYDLEAVMKVLIGEFMEKDKEGFMARYKLKEEDMVSPEVIMETIGKKRGCLVKGGLIDLEKAQRILLDDYRNMKLGTVSFDGVDEEPYYVEGEEDENHDD